MINCGHVTQGLSLAPLLSQGLAHHWPRFYQYLTSAGNSQKEKHVAIKRPKSVRDLHALGKRFDRLSAARISRGEGIHGTLDALKATSAAEKNRLMEARRFARLYSDEELELLCGLGQRAGRPLNKFHVLHLIRVADGKRRNNLAKRCAEEYWSVRRLEQEIRRVGPRRRYGGRKHEPPESIYEALLVTERMAAGWLRWVGVLRPVRNETSKKRITLARLPRSIRRKLRDISKHAEQLCAEIAPKLTRKSSKPRKRIRRRTQTPSRL